MNVKILSTQSVTADTTPGLISLPDGLGGDTPVVFTFAPSRAVNVELRMTASGGGHYIIPEDSALADNYTSPVFKAANAPLYVYAASSQALTITVAQVIA